MTKVTVVLLLRVVVEAEAAVNFDMRRYQLNLLFATLYNLQWNWQWKTVHGRGLVSEARASHKLTQSCLQALYVVVPVREFEHFSKSIHDAENINPLLLSPQGAQSHG